MKTPKRSFFKKKTTWASLLAIAGAVAAVATGQMSIVQGIQIAVPAILALFIGDRIDRTANGGG